MLFGKWVDGKLKQTDKKGEYLYTLQDLLGDGKAQQSFSWSPGQAVKPLKKKE